MGTARRGRRAISPIVVTVLIVASTLVASYAISRFVFGISPAIENNATYMAVTKASMSAADFKSTFTDTRFTCGSPVGSYLTISNTGTAGATITAATLTWAGSTNSYSLSGSCNIGALGSSTSTQNVLFGGATEVITANAASGGTFTGTLTLDNGAVVHYTGTFN